MVTVNVICGGTSAEREVSLRSGASVAAALKQAGFEVKVLDSKSADLKKIVDCDVVFPVLHGAGGEDGKLQVELEKSGVRFVGSGSAASALCFDKWKYRAAVTAAGLPMASGALVTTSNFATNQLTQRPFVLKPVSGGSSIDTFIVRDLGKIPHEKIKESFARYQTMLIEELIEGSELTVGVLGDQALPIIKIIPPENGEFDYKNKYNGKSREIVAPKDIDQKTQKLAQALALKAHQLTGCRDFSRTDMMLNRAGKIFLLETNTIPGMTNQSLYPKMAAAAELDMAQLVARLVSFALAR